MPRHGLTWQQQQIEGFSHISKAILSVQGQDRAGVLFRPRIPLGWPLLVNNYDLPSARIWSNLGNQWLCPPALPWERKHRFSFKHSVCVRNAWNMMSRSRASVQPFWNHVFSALTSNLYWLAKCALHKFSIQMFFKLVRNYVTLKVDHKCM